MDQSGERTEQLGQDGFAEWRAVLGVEAASVNHEYAAMAGAARLEQELAQLLPGRGDGRAVQVQRRAGDRCYLLGQARIHRPLVERQQGNPKRTGTGVWKRQVLGSRVVR